MTRIIYVNTGEVKIGDKETILNSGAIGSCLAVTMYNPIKRTGAMAHIMLPGFSPSQKENSNTKYARNAINELLKLISDENNDLSELETCIIGGANVLNRPSDKIGENNIKSVEVLLNEVGINICARAVGGLERRTAIFDIKKGCVFFTVGDSKQKILWQNGSL